MSIMKEESNQLELNKTIKERNMLLSKLKLSFQHTLDVLRHVGDKHTAKKTYDNHDLELPLLKFNAFPPRARPPSPNEESGNIVANILLLSYCAGLSYSFECIRMVFALTFAVPIIVELLKQRVHILMNAYDEEKFRKERADGIKAFHDAVLQDMHSEEVKALENMLDPSKRNSSFVILARL